MKRFFPSDFESFIQTMVQQDSGMDSPFWNSTFAKRTWTGKQTDFRVTHFNMLARGLSEEHASFGEFDVDKRVLYWQARRWTILYTVLRPLDGKYPFLINIVECDQPDWFAAHLGQKEYQCFHVKKETAPAKALGSPFVEDGTFLAIRRDIFEVIGDPHVLRMDNQVALAVVLKEKIGERFFVFCGSHLKSKEGFEEKREKQANLLGTWLLSIGPKHAIRILCVDLNDIPGSLAYKSITTHFSSSVDLDWTTAKSRSGEKKIKTIDYIFTQGLDPVGHLDVPKEIPVSLLPNTSFPSDHIDLSVCF